MLTDLWRQFLTLPQWQQALGSGGVLIVAGLAVRTAVSLLTRRRRRTLYVLDERGHATGRESRAALSPPDESPAETLEEPAEDARQEPAEAPAEERAEAPAEERAEALPERPSAHREAPADAASVEPLNSDWAGNRPLCPCCGYPTAMDEFNELCPLCDWSEAETDDVLPDGVPWLPSIPLIHSGLGAEERADELTLARANFARYGSVYPPEERPEELSVLNERQMNLRRDLRERFDYLKSDPPDISETWELIDGLLTGLREEGP